MPKWGLTKEQIESQPWDLEPRLLDPDKTITNSVQGDVYINRLERMFVDSEPLQRLRRIKQVGNTHLVYPDATHTRFSHSLGTLRAAQDLLDALIDQENRPHPEFDLLQEWRERLPEKDRLRQIAEVVVLTRLGALLHDLCHVPFGHAIEDDLGLLPRHDANLNRFNILWKRLPGSLRDAIGNDLKDELRRLILSKEEPAEDDGSRYPFVADLVGNTICADLLDYLARDHLNMGLPIAIGHRFLEGLYVTRSEHPHYKERVAIQVIRDGAPRADIITELLKVLRYRYEESERALVHHAKLGPDAMIGKLLAMLGDSLWVERALGLFDAVGERERKDIDELRQVINNRPIEDLLEASRRAQLRTPPNSSRTQVHDQVVRHLDDAVQANLESLFLSHGDDGLLEHVRRESEEMAKKQKDSRRAAIATLADGVLNRNLYKRIGLSLPDDRPLAQSLWDQYGQPDSRRRLEVEAAEFVGLTEKWHLLLWVPSPEMRLKLAFVHVGGGDWVVKLHDFSPEVREIYESHQRLWAISVYVHEDVRMNPLRAEALLAWLRERLGLKGWVHSPAREESVEAIAVRHFAAERDLSESRKKQLLAGVSGFSPTERPSLDLLMKRLDLIADSLDEER